MEPLAVWRAQGFGARWPSDRWGEHPGGGRGRGGCGDGGTWSNRPRAGAAAWKVSLGRTGSRARGSEDQRTQGTRGPRGPEDPEDGSAWSQIEASPLLPIHSFPGRFPSV